MGGVTVETKKFVDVYPSDPPMPVVEGTFDGGPMSISHWGMHDLGRFGVIVRGNEAEWQEDGETFEVREWAA